MHMTGFAIIALLGVLASVGACEKADPIARMTVALGGEDAARTLTSLSVAADCTGPAGAFQTEIESLRPSSVYFHQSSNRDTTEIWSVPSSTWIRYRGKITVADRQIGQIAHDHEFHLILFDFNARYPVRDGAPTRETIDGVDCTRVGVLDPAQNRAAIYIDTHTQLPRVFEMNPPGATGPVRVYFDDWRPIEGLMYFHAFRLTEGTDRTFTYQYTSILPNSVDAKRFDVPEEARPAAQ